MEVIYEDNHIIVVNKPAGIPSQGDKSGDKDMLSIVKEYLREKYNKPGNVYVGLVHRLDRMTSGLMVFAKTSKGASRLSESIRIGDFKKEYMAVVSGTMNIGKTEELEDYLVKNEKTNTSRVTDSTNRNAKLAKLKYTVIGNTKYNGKDYSYIRVKLYTGRHHQIRVQLSNIGHPLYGDVKYGNIKGELALFACHLEFIHPTKDEIMTFDLLPRSEGIWEGI